MTGYQSKKAAALDEDGMYLVHHTQPTQKPVAWAVYDKRGGSKSLHWPDQHSPDGDANMFDAVPLYTTPPQRPWVGLTDEQIADYLGDEYHDMTESELRFFRLGEVAAKEKNNG